VKPIRQDVLDPPPIPKPISTKIKVDLEPIDYLPNAEPVQNLPVLKKILSKGAAPYFDKKPQTHSASDSGLSAQSGIYGTGRVL
jgi:hypothetical protein